MGQSDTKWLNKAGEMTDPCGFPARFSGKAMGVFCRKSRFRASEACHKQSN